MKAETIDNNSSIYAETSLSTTVDLEVEKGDVSQELMRLDRSSRKTFRRLTDEMVFKEHHALDVVKMSSEQRKKQAEEYKRQIVVYRNLMYVVSLNSGWFSYSTGVVQFALLYILKSSSSDTANFLAAINAPWNFKPLFGFLSDNFAIFGFR